ncbi:sugar phosphate isomerase/epimerase family protein [Flavivirga spongiicola]|uniref:Sugar phosphate isomerase/epimerase n=1 Tax=Flavivirga spongiicola TaxID=421621 RepID=A0ABU7XT16_9FLAO|nr:TIM barrel protein [Flavivirga sp. MEBiC05379]MDO5978089.1 TIM barrel protein [Flavivirga sp. MEBiC05379]
MKNTSKTALGLGLTLSFPSFIMAEKDSLFFKISLAQWSLHRSLRSGKLTTFDFPAKAKNDFGIHAVEYVNQFFLDKAKDLTFLKELKQRTSDLNVKNVLIMIDAEGELGDQNKKARFQAVENHYKWVEAAQFLGCSSIRVNINGKGSSIDVAKAGENSLRQLSNFAKDYSINIIVENHQGYSTHGDWLSEIMKNVNLSNCGTLPDFGNFYEYDRYQGVKDMMPFAKGVSAKTNNFDALGNETQIDYVKMLQIVKDMGYTGHIGIEYEGSDDDEGKGIRLTKELLIKAARGIK